PAHPHEIGYHDTPGNASGLDISGTNLFLADGGAGLRVIDIANTFDPKEIGFIDTDGSALKVAVNGSFAYIADGSAGLCVIDISNPYEPAKLTPNISSNNILDVAIRSNYAFIAADEAGLRVLDISNPYNPSEIGRYEGYKSVAAVALSDYYAYAIDTQVGLGIINISNPYQLTQAGFFTTNGDPSDVALSGTNAYVTDRHRGLRMIDVSRPNQPQQQAFFLAGGISKGVAVQNNHAYLAQQDAGIRVIDIENPSQPVLIGSLDLNGRAEEIKVKDDFAFVTNYENGLRIIRVTDPAKPVEAGFFNQNIHARSVAIEGSLAFIADSSFGLRIVDVTNPLQPSLIGSCQIQNIQAEDICKAADYVFLAGGDEGLRIIDVANPVQPVAVGVFDADDSAISIAVDENYAYLGYLQKKLSIVDISDPINPSEIGYIDLVNPANALAVKGRYIYIADGDSGLRVIDAMVPSNPVEVGYYVTGSAAFDVTIDDQFVYLVDQNTGLYILEFEMASGNVAPEPPLLIAPDNNSFVNSVTPQFSWQSPRDTNGDLLHFKIELDEDGDWTNVDFKIDSRFGPIGFSPAPPVPQASGVINYASQFQLSEGKWHWRVSAWDGLAASDFSDTWKFTVDTTAPIIRQFVFENPGYGENWFQPSQDSIVNAFVLYSELFPERGKLSSILLPDTIRISVLPGGYDQELRLQFSIANQSDGDYSVCIGIQDSAGNIGSATKKIQLDSAAPYGYSSDAPDTIIAGQDYVVHIFGASDGQGCGVAEIFLDVFKIPGGEPVTAQDSVIGNTEPGVYYYRYFAIDNLGNRGTIKTDTTVVLPLVSQAPIFPVPQSKEVKAGKEFWLAIIVGTEQETVQKLSRVSYVLNYSNTQFVNIISDSVLPGSFLGEDIDFNYQIEDARGRVTITIAQQAGGSGASGFGIVGQIKFTSDPGTPDQTPVIFTLSSIYGNDPMGYPIDLIPQDTTITIIRPVYDFTMVVAPDSQAVYPGETAEVTATFSLLGEFNSKISLEISELPDGMQALYPDQPFDIPDSINITFTTSDQIQAGICHPVITATGGGISRQQKITITVLEPVSLADFSMIVAPDSQVIYQGESTKFTLSFQPLGGFDAPVELMITNLPSGMKASYPSDPFTIPTSLDIGFATESDIEPGVYFPTITATGGGVTHQVSVKIRVLQRIDFIMIIRPDSQSVVAGQSIDFEISFIPVGGFNSKITVAVSNVPEGMETIFTSRPFDIPITFNITFRVPNNVPPEIYRPIVTASGGGIIHQQTIIIHVLARG
ncbi:hypothetical protein L0Z72_02495, partial [candidate division KSB1 bacterium]|nr:hypothetical protein [candidate division KSB1 bacterium]